MKQEGKDRFGSQFTMWQKKAWEFEIDDQAPVRYKGVTAHRNCKAWYKVVRLDMTCEACMTAT